MKKEQKTDSKGLAARILGEQPTAVQKTIIWLMILSLLVWPIDFFGSIFIWDAPIQSTIDEISRWGATLTVWLYPIYLFPLIRLWFKLSKKSGMTWLFCLCPLIPVAVFSLFVTLASSTYADRKPEGYDPSTYKQLNDTYALDVNHVYYRYEILESANPGRFKALSDDYATDMHHVWYNDCIIEGAEPSTFVVPDGDISTLAHDSRDYYRGCQPLHVKNMASFKQIDSNWALDSLHVYYLGIGGLAESMSVGDYRTFKALNEFYAIDAKCVYYKNNIVEGADPASFAVLKGQYHYGQDRHRAYYEAYGSTIRDFNALRHKDMENGMYNAFHTDGTTVYNPELMAMPEGTDFATIHRIEKNRSSCWYADKKRVYYKNRLLPGANPQTFMIFPSHYVHEDYVADNNLNTEYSHDGNYVFCRDSLMAGADVASFVCGYDFVAGQSFAFDKNQYYQGTPNPRIEKLRQGK